MLLNTADLIYTLESNKWEDFDKTKMTYNLGVLLWNINYPALLL